MMFPFETIVQIYLYKREIQEVFHQIGQTRVSEYWFMATPSSEKWCLKMCLNCIEKHCKNEKQCQFGRYMGGYHLFIYACIYESLYLGIKVSTYL